MDDALARGLVEQAGGVESGGLGGVSVAGLDSGVNLLDRGLELRLHRTIALVRLLVGEDALLLALDVCHVRVPPDELRWCPSQWGAMNPRESSTRPRASPTRAAHSPSPALPKLGPRRLATLNRYD